VDIAIVAATITQAAAVTIAARPSHWHRPFIQPFPDRPVQYDCALIHTKYQSWITVRGGWYLKRSEAHQVAKGSFLRGGQG